LAATLSFKGPRQNSATTRLSPIFPASWEEKFFIGIYPLRTKKTKLKPITAEPGCQK
jgi:hypothetical protein